MPVKFDNCGVNVAGIQYRVHSIGIRISSSERPVWSSYTNYQNIKNGVSITYSLRISIRPQKKFDYFWQSFSALDS